MLINDEAAKGRLRSWAAFTHSERDRNPADNEVTIHTKRMCAGGKLPERCRRESAETEAARRARDPLGPATRVAPELPTDGDDVEAVKRLIDPTRRRRPRQR